MLDSFGIILYNHFLNLLHVSVPPVDLERFRFLRALGVPPPPPFPIFTPIPWVVSCRWRWAFCRKVWSHRPQQNGRTSSCILIWTTKLYDFENVFPQTSPFSKVLSSLHLRRIHSCASYATRQARPIPFHGSRLPAGRGSVPFWVLLLPSHYRN